MDRTQAIIDALRLDTAERILRDVAAEYGETGTVDSAKLRVAARQVRMAQDSERSSHSRSYPTKLPPLGE